MNLQVKMCYAHPQHVKYNINNEKYFLPVSRSVLAFFISFFKRGKALAWDATCTDSFSTSNLCSTILNPDSASSAAENLKRRQYSQLVADLEFVPVAVETSGIIGSAGCSLLTDIYRRISRATNDPRQMSYIFQQTSVAIIRGNALAMTSPSRKYAQELVERH